MPRAPPWRTLPGARAKRRPKHFAPEELKDNLRQQDELKSELAKVDKNSQEGERIRAELDRLTKDKSDLEKQRSIAEEQSKGEAAARKRIEQQASTQQGEYDAAQKQISTLQQSLKEARGEAQGHAKSVGDLTGKVAELEKQLAAANVRAEANEKKSTPATPTGSVGLADADRQRIQKSFDDFGRYFESLGLKSAPKVQVDISSMKGAFSFYDSNKRLHIDKDFIQTPGFALREYASRCPSHGSNPQGHEHGEDVGVCGNRVGSGKLFIQFSGRSQRARRRRAAAGGCYAR